MSSPNVASDKKAAVPRGKPATNAEYSLFGALCAVVTLGSVALTNHQDIQLSQFGWKMTVIMVTLACIGGIAVAARAVGPFVEPHPDTDQAKK